MKKLASYRIYLPDKDSEDRWSLEEAGESREISADYSFATVPTKKTLFPQREVFLEYRNPGAGGLEIKEILPEEQKVIVFGARPCDGRAASHFDKVFGGEFEDPYYWKRRNATTLVGLACASPPSDHCFCFSLGGSPHGEEGLDILLTDLGDRYFVKALTKKGTDLILQAKDLFRAPKPADKKEADKIHLESEKKLPRRLEDPGSLPQKLRSMFDSPFWDEEAMGCLRCGICTYLCPTCHCFDINDETESASPLRGMRVRIWDNCQFPDFTMHSSGHNPRPDKASRLRQRMLHKFQYFVELYNAFQCVGCGRCISLCPVGIDIIEVLDKVRAHGQ